MKQTLFALLTIALFFTGCKDNKQISPVLKTVVEETNKQCPLQIDPVTTLVSNEALPGNVLRQNFKVDFKTELTDTVVAKRATKRRALYNVVTAPQIKSLRDINASILYVYTDTNGKYLYQVLITPDDYNAFQKDNRSDKEVLAELLPDMVWNNKLLIPMRLDEVTTLVDYTAAEPDTLVAIYDLDSKVKFEDFDISLMKKILVQNTKNDISAQEVKDRNGIFKHVYRDVNGKAIEIVITPAMYK
ncbi:hypothetical protein [Dysgonomonas macrotermitis]|uniref:Lipoprotein n=1 Tax=Dysgonomonas macrotermitis TaxID=1346286 RepID=A0A1M5F325_9BACT|nr:hypothetical protein [Dysgonomonas macrotermitis]SHF85896.1 hypothetical protein SAMN05444362_11136 [Dysgonomonas macrotermitis]